MPFRTTTSGEQMLNAAHRQLGRVLRSEVDVSSLLAYCITLDPLPFAELVGLREPISGVITELPAGRAGRLDLALRSGDATVAVIEVKVSATEHGDQFDRYDAYAASVGARTILLELEASTASMRDGWTRVSLVDAFGCWSTSTNEAARVVAGEIAEVFSSWHHQFSGPFGEMDPAVTAIGLRAVVRDLADELEEVTTGSTAGGQPTLLAFEPYPGEPTGAWLCVDLRSHAMFDPARP